MGNGEQDGEEHERAARQAGCGSQCEHSKDESARYGGDSGAPAVRAPRLPISARDMDDPTVDRRDCGLIGHRVAAYGTGGRC